MARRSRRVPARWRLAVLSASLALVAGACSSASDADVGLRLRPYAVVLSETTVTEGALTFDIDVTGDQSHELVIVRTPDGGAPGPPLLADGRLDTAKADVVDRAGPFVPGRYRSGTPNLNAGRYLFLCDLVTEGAAPTSHLRSGMAAELRVVTDPDRTRGL